MGEQEALLLRAKENFKDNEIFRKSGEKWMIRGPCEYIPPVEVEILELRHSIPLDENEGIYIRNINSGEVRAFIGETYLLKAHEILWEKNLHSQVETLLDLANAGLAYIRPKKNIKGKYIYEHKVQTVFNRVKSNVVRYKVPHSFVVQLYDYKNKEKRYVFGPDLVILKPYEEITVLSMSGGTPKVENAIKSLGLSLGPDFMRDIVILIKNIEIQIFYNNSNLMFQKLILKIYLHFYKDYC